jgi:hypothetical protein
MFSFLCLTILSTCSSWRRNKRNRFEISIPGPVSDHAGMPAGKFGIYSKSISFIYQIFPPASLRGRYVRSKKSCQFLLIFEKPIKNEAFFVFTVNSESFSRELCVKLAIMKFSVLQRKQVYLIVLYIEKKIIQNPWTFKKINTALCTSV